MQDDSHIYFEMFYLNSTQLKAMRLERYPDNAYNQIKKYGKGRNDATKSINKKCWFGGGGLVIPEFMSKKNEPVLSRPNCASRFMKYLLQVVSSARVCAHISFNKS